LDRTWLRRHDLRDTVKGIVRKLPPSVEKAVRRLAGKEKEKEKGSRT
jgi:hypothetical protein